jgi:hypothetical protein
MRWKVKSIAELLQEYPGEETDLESQRKWLNGQMAEALGRYSANIRPELASQSQQNWYIQMMEFIVGLVTEEDDREAAITAFREFAQHAQLVNLYNALVVSTEKRLVVAKK